MSILSHCNEAMAARQVLSLIVIAREAHVDGDSFYLEATLENAEVEQFRLVQLLEATGARLNAEQPARMLEAAGARP